MLKRLLRFLTDQQYRDATLIRWHEEGERRPSIPALWLD